MYLIKSKYSFQQLHPKLLILFLVTLVSAQGLLLIQPIRVGAASYMDQYPASAAAKAYCDEGGRVFDNSIGRDRYVRAGTGTARVIPTTGIELYGGESTEQYVNYRGTGCKAPNDSFRNVVFYGVSKYLNGEIPLIFGCGPGCDDLNKNGATVEDVTEWRDKGLILNDLKIPMKGDRIYMVDFGPTPPEGPEYIGTDLWVQLNKDTDIFPLKPTTYIRGFDVYGMAWYFEDNPLLRGEKCPNRLVWDDIAFEREYGTMKKCIRNNGTNEITYRWQIRVLPTTTSKANRPFLRVSGGDVRSGANFEGYPGGKCTSSDATKNAAIETNGYQNTGTTPWGSSSAQYGVFATGEIKSQTGNNSINDANFFGNDFKFYNERKSLLFANAGLAADPYGKFYGGGEGVPCIDVSGLVKGTVEIPSSTPVGAGDTIEEIIGNRDKNKSKDIYKGNVTIEENSRVIVRGSHVVVIDGDLTIESNISYNADYGTEIDKIPNLTVVVMGNINIKSDVKTLNGTYIAYPKNASSGVINTCSDAPEKLSVNDVCSDDQLKVTGRLIANSIVWNRTRGTVGEAGSVISLPTGCIAAGPVDSQVSNSNNCAAENIVFSPEAFFNNTENISFGEVSNVPVTTKDLPPVY